MTGKKRSIHLMAVTMLSLTLGLIGILLMEKRFFYLASAILVLSILSPWFGRKIGRPLIRVAEGFVFLVVRLLLALFYLLVMMPWSLIYRIKIAAQDLQHRKAQSMFEDRSHQYVPGDFERNW